MLRFFFFGLAFDFEFDLDVDLGFVVGCCAFPLPLSTFRDKLVLVLDLDGRRRRPPCCCFRRVFRRTTAFLRLWRVLCLARLRADRGHFRLLALGRRCVRRRGICSRLTAAVYIRLI